MSYFLECPENTNFDFYFCCFEGAILIDGSD